MDIQLTTFSEGENAAAEGANAPESEAFAENDTSAPSPDEEFEELIRGKYADAFNKRTKGIIDKRLRKFKDLEENAGVLSPLLESISADFPHIEKTDTRALVQAFLERKASLAQAENRKKENSALFIKAEEYIKQKAALRLKDVLLEESEKLRAIYPSFDLHREYASSPEFRSLLGAGVDLRRAFEAVNLEKIMGSAMRYAVMKAQKNTADAIKSTNRGNYGNY